MENVEDHRRGFEPQEKLNSPKLLFCKTPLALNSVYKRARLR